MKAISIKEPWLQLIIDGKKTVEFRTWKPRKHDIVGESLLLCASKARPAPMNLSIKMAPFYMERFDGEQFDDEMAKTINVLYNNLGHARAIVRVKNIVVASTNEHFNQPGYTATRNGSDRLVWAWELENIRALVEPFPVKGKLGIYEVSLPGPPYQGVSLTKVRSQAPSSKP